MSADQPLAARYYTSTDCFERDQDRIFYRAWQCVCHVSEVTNTGDYASCDIATRGSS